MLQTSPESASRLGPDRCHHQPVRVDANRFDPVEFDVERKRAESLISFGGRLTSLHRHLVTGSVEFADGPVWIADRLDVCAATAREWIRVGRALSGLDATAVAFQRGDLTFAKVRDITRIATADNEETLLHIAATLPAEHIGKALAAWSIRNEPFDAVEARQQACRGVCWRNEPDGMVTATMRFTPLAAGTIQAAIDAQMMRTTWAKNSQGVWPTVANRRADSITHLLTGCNGTSPDFEVIIHVKGDGNTLDDGTPVPDGPIAGLLPKAFTRLFIPDIDTRPVNASSRRRFPTDQQKRLVKERDQTCIDCGRHDLLEYDHLPAYNISRQTHTDQLQLRCAPCHTNRHRAE